MADNSPTIINKKPFDLREAIVLLDVYLLEKHKDLKRTESVRIASERLRDLAARQGLSISDSFRSPTGLQNRLRSIAGIYEGKESVSAPGTEAFREAVALYKNDRQRFQQILWEAEGVSPHKSVRKAKKATGKIVHTKFVRTKKDQQLKDKYPACFNDVYYALKRLCDKNEAGVTSTDVFVELGRRIKRKDILVILNGASWSKALTGAHFVFYDKEQEERKKRQMDEALKTAENVFFAWLPSVIPPHALDDVKNSYKIVSSMLVQKKVLAQPLLATTQIGQVEYALKQVKRVFGGKRLRNNATKLSAAYLTYLRENKKTQPAQAETPMVDVQEDWIRFDFTNAQSFERTSPVYCCIDGTVVDGRTWARILVAIVEQEISNENSALEALYKKPLYANKANRPFFMKKKIDGLNCSELSNGYWINVNWGIPRLMEIIQAFCLHCGYDKKRVVLYGVPKGTGKEENIDRKPFDIPESVILLDVYLLERKNQLTRTEASTIASKRLRNLAVQRGISISDSFRSPRGLQNRLRSIGGLYEEQESASAPGTEAFREAVSLYKNDRPRFQQILQDASSPILQIVEKKSEETRSTRAIDINRAVTCLRDAGLQGLTVHELIDLVQPNAAVSPTRSALDENQNVIAMPENRYMHVDSFVDLDEAEEILGTILRTHFAQFDGYSNNQLLFRAASQELSLFLNDNDCENVEAVYAIARFLFEKKAAAGEPYKFSAPHIFEREPDYPMTLRGLMINLARNNGGVLNASDAKSYLQKTMLVYGSIGQLLQIGSSNTFLIYDSERYILSETIGINDAWCRQMHDKLDDLFRKANVAYVIPRDISTAWLDTLPPLPLGLTWTHLLLQEVLDKYPAIGFKSISPDLNQTHDTLAAAFVPADSPLQSFPDVVTLFMEERHTLPRRMSGEELRQELREAGMLEAGEMIYALPKALDDYRFAWTDENKTVLVRGNK